MMELALSSYAWGDSFLQLSQDEKKLDLWEKKAKVLKEKLLEKLSIADGVERLELIDILYHLGVSYNFDKEIEEALEKMYKTYDEDAPEDNLYYLALRFRLLRQHGWNASSDVFNKFKNAKNGSFKESVASDVVGMLSLYEASYAGTKEDKILDEAIAFTAKHLRAALPNMEDPLLAERVAHSLELPQHKRLQRLEARYFINLYEKDNAHDKMLLEYAKLDYNFLQALHQNEMKELTKWWKQLDLLAKMKFARDRVTEIYYWPLGAHFEPQYSRNRIIASKIMNITSVIDDVYDVYGTEEEIKIFTDAIPRWDMKAMEDLPDYVKPLYEALLGTLKDFEGELALEGNAYQVSFLQQAMKDICREYFVEARWYNAGIVPKVKEYLHCAEITCGYPMIVIACFAGAGEIATKKFMQWVHSYPKYMEDTCRLCQIVDDVKSRKFEQERGHVASVIDCYMKEHKCIEEEAVEKLNEDVTNTWKDINKACMQPSSFPMAAMNIIRNLSRVMEVLYQFGDGYTFSNGKTKEDITLLLIDPIPI